MADPPSSSAGTSIGKEAEAPHPSIPVDVSIVIRTLNEAKYLASTLERVLSQKTSAAIEIIVVDSGSSDGTVDEAMRFADRVRLEVVHIDPEDFSYGRALNRGIERCNAPIVINLSAHCVPLSDDWLERLIQPLQDPVVAGVFGRQVGCDDVNPYENADTKKVYLGQLRRYDSSNSRSPTANGFPAFSNANAAIRRSVWLECPFSESMVWAEDRQWAHRVMQLGGAICYCQEADVSHSHELFESTVLNRFRSGTIGHYQADATRSGIFLCLGRMIWLLALIPVYYIRARWIVANSTAAKPPAIGPWRYTRLSVAGQLAGLSKLIVLYSRPGHREAALERDGD